MHVIYKWGRMFHDGVTVTWVPRASHVAHDVTHVTRRSWRSSVCWGRGPTCMTRTSWSRASRRPGSASAAARPPGAPAPHLQRVRCQWWCTIRMIWRYRDQSLRDARPQPPCCLDGALLVRVEMFCNIGVRLPTAQCLQVTAVFQVKCGLHGGRRIEARKWGLYWFSVSDSGAV